MNVCGKNIALELLKNNRTIHKAYIYDHFSDQNIITALQKKNIKIEYKTKRELDNLEKNNHQGIILSIPDYQYAKLDYLLDNIKKEMPIIVIMDHLLDPHNFGAIIRTCEAAGIDGIIIPKDRSVDINSTVMKVSVGALDYIPICQVSNLVQTINTLKERGFWIVGTDMDATPYEMIDYNAKIGLIIGSEGDGMSQLVKKTCDYIASIPMRGQINSLNASVAAGIMIYKIIETRK